ncbi:MAG: hypothetical protein IJF71_05270, partial [Clostridia bacterium]|nr:hypothetical protein [Clostridia bacterium]
TGLYEVYTNDQAEYAQGKRTLWGAYNTWVLLGDNFRTTFIKATQDMTTGVKTASETFTLISKQLKTAASAYMISYEYDTTKW